MWNFLVELYDRLLALEKYLGLDRTKMKGGKREGSVSYLS